jgi:hypothetical protein
MTATSHKMVECNSNLRVAICSVTAHWRDWVSAVGMASPRRGVQSLQLGGLTPDRHLIDRSVIRKVLEEGIFWLEDYWFVVAGRKVEKAAFVFAKVCRIISSVLACS